MRPNPPKERPPPKRLASAIDGLKTTAAVMAEAPTAPRTMGGNEPGTRIMNAPARMMEEKQAKRNKVDAVFNAASHQGRSNNGNSLAGRAQFLNHSFLIPPPARHVVVDAVQDAAVDIETRCRNPVGFLGQQEQNAVRDIHRLAHAPKRRHVASAFFDLGVL